MTWDGIQATGEYYYKERAHQAVYPDHGKKHESTAVQDACQDRELDLMDTSRAVEPLAVPAPVDLQTAMELCFVENGRRAFMDLGPSSASERRTDYNFSGKPRPALEMNVSTDEITPLSNSLPPEPSLIIPGGKVAVESDEPADDDGQILEGEGSQRKDLLAENRADSAQVPGQIELLSTRVTKWVTNTLWPPSKGSQRIWYLCVSILTVVALLPTCH